MMSAAEWREVSSPADPKSDVRYVSHLARIITVDGDRYADCESLCLTIPRTGAKWVGEGDARYLPSRRCSKCERIALKVGLSW